MRNRLTLIRDTGKKNKYGHRIALYQCSCGNTKEIVMNSVNSGNTKSCGCLHKEISKEIFKQLGKNNKTHGLSRNTDGKITPLYNRWGNMKSRCINAKARGYKDYGGRGITVCEEWKNDYVVFYDWSLKNGYNKNKQIHRKNNDLGYFPENCVYLTRAAHIKAHIILNKQKLQQKLNTFF